MDALHHGPASTPRPEFVVDVEAFSSADAWVVRRTVVRRLRDEELWNGTKEAPLHTVFTDPEHIVRWAWRTRHLLRELVPEVEATHPQLVVVRLHNSSDVERFVAGLATGVA